MITSKKQLYYKIYNELVNNGVIVEEDNKNFDDEYYLKREYLRTIEEIMQDLYVLDKLHELK